MNPSLDPTRTQQLAYQIWESEGRPDGRNEEHWIEAERRLRVAGSASVDSVGGLDGDVAKLDGDVGVQGRRRRNGAGALSAEKPLDSVGR